MKGVIMGSVIRVCHEIDGVSCISTTELGRLIGFHLSASFLEKNICKPFATMNCGVYWAVKDVKQIRINLARFILESAQ